MTGNTLSDVRVLVLAPGDTEASKANSRGHLFEVFVAKLLHAYGYEEPTTRSLNVTSDGIELDVVARARLTKKLAIAECKAYSRPVKAAELTNFYGKLTVERFADRDAYGLMAVIPRLSPDGEEKARTISAQDENFIYLSSQEIADRLRAEKMVSDAPTSLGLTSDPAIIITADGIYSSLIAVDEISRIPIEVVAWAASGSVPAPTISLIEAHEYAQGLRVRDLRQNSNTESRPRSTIDQIDSPILVAVKGSDGDFEYQLPASPRYFIGRKAPLKTATTLIGRVAGSVVLNAQSGWGKSSLALKIAEIAKQRGGYSLVLDSRTAQDPRFVSEALRRAATEAASDGLLSLPDDATWASLSSCLHTLDKSKVSKNDRPLVVFFDQFENVFKSESLTRAFRDLSAGVKELQIPLTIGFAWKTDLVGWTEGHPYQLRDEIRANSTVLIIEPFGSSEVSTLLGRLERELGEKLSPDLRSRLREYSQGLPWLLKKLSDHVLGEIRSGATQEKLIAEALNVQSLFDGDLAQLSPSEQETIRHVARYAPLPASEVTDRFGPDAIQSLVDRRLLVQIGERLDTYWDTFRDYLNTGRVPVEDSYILRMSPNSVARLLPHAIQAGGSIAVKDLKLALQTSTNVIFNLSRELRLLGITSYDPNRVTVVDEIASSRVRESALKRRVTQALKRHKAFTTLMTVAERSGGAATISTFADELPRAFPAVAVKPTTWNSYARVYLAWFSYAGLAIDDNGRWSPRPEGDAQSTIKLLTERPVVRARAAVPQEAPRRSIAILARLGQSPVVELPPNGAPDRDAVRTLLSLGAVEVTQSREVLLTRSDLLTADNSVNPSVLRSLLEAVPGGKEGIDQLLTEPDSTPARVGEVIKAATAASWTTASTQSIGGYFRAWAKHAGVCVLPVKRGKAGTLPKN